MVKHHGTLELAPTTEENRASALGRILPNVVTLLSLCCGISAIELAIMGRHREAAIAIILAGVFDALDGRAARLLNAASTFGAELDSLADVVSFGVAPPLLVYHFSFHSFAGFGWVFVLFYAACCGLRLARFNTQLHDNPSDKMRGWFTGVPAPAGAWLALVPLFVAFGARDPSLCPPAFNIAVLAAVALLMVSRLPTWSPKHFRLGHDHLVPALIVAILLSVLLAVVPWWTLAAGGALYAASIPASVLAHRHLGKLERRGARGVSPN